MPEERQPIEPTLSPDERSSLRSAVAALLLEILDHQQVDRQRIALLLRILADELEYPGTQCFSQVLVGKQPRA